MHMNFNHTIVFFDSNQAKYIEKLKLRFCFGIILGILHKDNKILIQSFITTYTRTITMKTGFSQF